MTFLNVEEITEGISRIPFVRLSRDLVVKDSILCGKIEVDLEELDKPLEFDLEIFPQYPLKWRDSETIRFINTNLLEYDHVMGNGSICIHTSHEVNLKDKLSIDLHALRTWILTYFVDGKNDANYEHIIVPESLRDDIYNAYLFTDVDGNFKRGDFGQVGLSLLNSGSYKGKQVINHFVQDFRFESGETYECKWSSSYRNSTSTSSGIFYFSENVPAHHNRFAFKNWLDFSSLLDQEFLSFLHRFEENVKSKSAGKFIPIFVGYKTDESNIHWQVALLDIGKFPLVGVAERKNGFKTGRWNSELIDAPISWALTRNCSYELFFGRGSLDKEIVNKRILLLGVGAVGSILANTLVRGGCRFIDVADYDVKEPENVCRSEYIFQFGINDKVNEIRNLLTSISPFVEIEVFKVDCFEGQIKTSFHDKEAKKQFASVLNYFDIVFDCTTDNDLMFILNSLELNCDVINLSITNHAKDLVCAYYPNLYRFVMNQYSTILENDTDDLYSPTGCWSPTFKASYNDINLLVQMAIKKINLSFSKGGPKNNFVLKTDTSDGFSIKVEEH